MSHSRNPPQRGQGAARARQMGLLLDLSPDGALDDGGNEEELEAELLALMGGGGGRTPGKKGGGRAPVPMAEIEKMAALCMKDLDDEEVGDEDLDDDEDLLAELNEVLEDNEEETSNPLHPAIAPSSNVEPHSTPITPSGSSGLESRLVERIDMYQTAIANAKATGESSKARRYDRALKTLQSMLTSVKKGKAINEEEIPPPVATGRRPSLTSQPEPIKEWELPAPALMPSLPTNQKPLREAPPAAHNAKPHHLTPPQKPAPAITPDTPAISPLTPCQPNAQQSDVKQTVLSRQREYKISAIQAKQGGNYELAKQQYLIAKKMDPLVEALDRGEPVDLSSLPPPPGDAVVECSSPPSQVSSRPAPQAAPASASTQVTNADLPVPGSIAEALQQRMEKYKTAAEGAKSKGDDRKARMHQRIVKQYQDAIKAHKAGRPVNLSELPVPPGCPPLQGSEGSQQNFMGVLETAMKLANQDAEGEEEDDNGLGEAAKPPVRLQAQKAKAAVPSVSGSSSAPSQVSKLGPKAKQQLDFLLLRRQAFVRAALRSKQMKDMAGAAQHLRQAKGLEPMISAAKSGLPVDISRVPSAPVSEEDYSLSRSRASPLSPRSSEQYHQLMELLRQQHEKCLGYSQQFTHMGNLAETTKFEKLAEECMKNIEILKKAHTKGLPVPKCRTEERTFNTVKIFPNLTANDMMLYIIRGINLPTPSGVSPSDLDASVKFEFPFPSVEEAQRDKTGTVKNTNSPEFKEQFKLNINRAHRGFKRVVQSKGIKFEIIHKGGLFKTDKVVGNAQLKLETLENQCEIREILEVLDGRKATGGKLEVKVKIREPLGRVQLQTVTEKWLVLEPLSSPSPPDRQKERAPSPQMKPRNEASNRSSHPSHSPPQYKLHSFSLLHYDKEKFERKIAEYRKNRRDPPSDLIHQHKEVTHRLQWQKAQLERGSPVLLAEYENVLRRFAHGLADSVKKFSSQGNRDAAKDALGRLKLVENELESLKRRRTV
ncbi:coiled-coil and C2 domain-containing protein 1A [Lampris incognitus]|uniref:coiled-coil and C2 domain-containing protein 1A n=1 Tax=Lampris incognitus TaxID=2546036 RepID=UPI0024B53155|nr:coiled-coil and C2 domain-containing protein 1A [Lampris incognitus]